MTLYFVLKGFLIGLAIAAPVGPIGVLCIRRTLADGRLAGLFSGLGAATADAMYGCVAGFGLTFISSFLVSQQTWLRLLGGGFLCYLGIKTFLAKPAEKPVETKNTGLLGAYVSTFFLTLTNPMTILSFAAIFAGLGLGNIQGDYLTAAGLVLGVFAGSSAWWLILSGAVGLFQAKFTPQALRWVNRASGMIILGFGYVTLWGLFH
jgi:threonine/homoserine/homoserine lactone efflux protein